MSDIAPQTVPTVIPAAPGQPRRAAQLLAGLALFAVLVWTWLIYVPAFTGYFAFDDFPNLTPLEIVKSDPGLDEIIRFTLHGASSPTGRPLSLVTFALQAEDWPLNPAGFMRVNLLLHLLNGVLLFCALLQLSRVMGHSATRGMWQSLAAAALWLVAPLQATAVIYVIQRMTELSASFGFLGMLLYLHGRERALDPRRSVSGLGWMTAGILVGGLIGVFAKENAALFPLLMLAVEGTLLAAVPKPERWRPWATVFLVAPALLLGAYLVASVWIFTDAYVAREFTLAERVMTEARVMVMYAYKLLLPWPSAVRLLYDDFPASRSLMDPWTTLPAIVAIAVVLAAALRLRRRWPLGAFAVLWFLAAHVLESTVLPLELVFEHRNYQASAGVWFALAAGAPQIWAWLPTRRLQVVLAGAAVAYLLLLSAVTLQISTLWGNPMLMSDWWMQRLPESKRARLDHVAALIGYRLPDVAGKVVRDGIEKWPDHPMFYLLQMRVSCQFPETVSLPQTAPVVDAMRVMRSEHLTAYHLIDTMLQFVEEGECPALKGEVMREIIEAGFDNPKLARARRNLLVLYSRALRTEGRVIESLDRLREVVDSQPIVELALQAALLELDAGRIDQARAYLVLIESDPRVSLTDRWSHRENIQALGELLAAYESGGTGADP